MIIATVSRKADWAVAFRCVLFLSATLWLSGRSSADDKLAEVIRNVEANESLYENLDVRIHMQYDIGDRTPFRGDEGQEIVHRDLDTHFVSQDGLFRLESQGVDADSGENRSKRRTLRLFGGEQTRLLEDDVLGNLMEGRVEDSGSVRPHTMLLRYQMMPARLSAYLRGHEAVRATAGAQWMAGLGMTVTHGGEAEFNGLKCHKVVVKTAVPGGGHPSSISELWLAESRNYLPVRLLVWAPQVSAEIPRTEGIADDLREVKPGIWFPFNAQVTAYQQGPLRIQGKQMLQWREDYVAESVSLEPAYDQSYFNDLTFPDGLAVYEVADGKATKSYRVGAPNSAGAPPPSGFQHWGILIAANLSIVTIVVLSVIWRKRRPSRGASSEGREIVT